MRSGQSTTQRSFSYRHRYDIIIIISLLLISAISLTIWLSLRHPGEFVRVEADGEHIADYSLSHDAEYSLMGGTNVLVIEGGAAYMKSADCPDRTCVNMGRVRYTGESIVCLPNKITVRVMGSGGVDLVS